MSQQVILKNLSNDPVLVGDRYLFPNETRTVPKKIADQAMANNKEGALGSKPVGIDDGVEAQTDNENGEGATGEESTPPADEEKVAEEAQQVDEKADDSETGAAGGAAKKRGSRSKPNTE